MVWSKINKQANNGKRRHIFIRGLTTVRDQWLLFFSQVAEITVVFLKPRILAYHVSWDPAPLPSVAFVSQANIDGVCKGAGSMLSKMRRRKTETGERKQLV